MELIRDLHGQLPKSVVTVGVFDGVHRGHRALLAQLVERAEARQLDSTLITFSNHPVEVLKPSQPFDLLQSLHDRLEAIEKCGVTRTICLRFTQELSQLSAAEFLIKIRHHLPFDFLMMGYDSAFGRSKEGGRERIEALSKEMAFEYEYLPPLLWNGEPISTSKIKAALARGDRQSAEAMLGYSLN